MRVLVVDDEEHLRRVMRLALEADGYEVAEAPDGEEALRQFGNGSSVDATLLDQKMPGLDGLETLRRMKQRRPDACVIMVTAYATIELAVDAMKLGATDFVRKPMTPDTLRHAVAAALSKRDHRARRRHRANRSNAVRRAGTAPTARDLDDERVLHPPRRIHACGRWTAIGRVPFRRQTRPRRWWRRRHGVDRSQSGCQNRS